jgi:carbamoyltransferase
MNYFLGINLSHDSSAAIVSSTGIIISAVSEERLSRHKNHSGIPIRSINLLLENFKNSIADVIIGSDSTIDSRKAKTKISQISNSPSSKEGEIYPYAAPAFTNNETFFNAREAIQRSILEHCMGLEKNTNFIWTNHHDAHLGQALCVSPDPSSLLISLDGHGDGESGAVSYRNHNKITNLARFKDLDSLGELYSAVTKRYNFKANHHEGKITGLAAYGAYSGAVETLFKYVSVVKGEPSIRKFEGFRGELVDRIFPYGVKKRLGTSILNLVELAEAKTNNYADLAFAIQLVLEESVLEIAKFWKNKTGAKSLALAGGVFANVKLNQRLAEELNFKSVRIFPGMGDGGISIGCIWSHLSKEKRLSDLESAFQDFFLAPKIQNEDEKLLAMDHSLEYLEISRSDLPREIALAVANSKLVGLHLGKMEFGPRALGNRSILIDPRFANINKIANERLKRTEFMPFAPAVLEEEATSWFNFDKIKDKFPFEYMTMTCSVLPQKRFLIPAVVHTDGTARPQLVNRNRTPVYWEAINEFKKITNIPIVINTSFNVHEEPINYTLSDSISALKRKSVDIIFTENGSFKGRS